MAELNARIIAKASGTAAEEPQASDLEVAELAVNTADGKLFTKHTDGSIVTISGGGGGGAVDSVNGQTGAVSLDLEDINDVKSYAPINTTGVWDTKDTNNVVNEDSKWTAAASGPNEWVQLSSLIDGVDYYTELSGLIVGGATVAVYDSADDSVLGTFNVVATGNNAGYQRVDFRDSSGGAAFDALQAHTGGIYISVDGTVWNTETVATISDGQVLTWVEANDRWEAATPSGGGATSLNDLSDVTYTNNSLQIDGLSNIQFDDDVPDGELWLVYDNATYGLSLGAYNTTTFDGSYFYVHPTKGVEIKMEPGAVFNISGPNNESNSTPEIRLNTGNPTSETPTGNYFGLTLPAGYSVDQTYVVPAADGSQGQVLSTDGAGVLSWESVSGGGSSSPSYVGFFGSKSGTYDAPTYDASFPAGTQEGDLAVLVVYTRAGTEASFASVTTPAGFTLRTGPNDYTSASNFGYISSRVFTKIVEASDPGSVVTLTTSPVDSNTDWFVGLSVFRNASYVDVEYLDTTAAGQQMSSSGYTYSGSDVSANSVSFFTAQSIYTVTNMSTRLTASTGEVNVMNGPIEDPSSTRRFTAWFMPQGSSDYNIRALNSSLNPISLTEGFHIYRIDLAYLPPADSISLSTLQAETAAATDFADFQARIAAL